jgi:hypothetical protein
MANFFSNLFKPTKTADEKYNLDPALTRHRDNLLNMGEDFYKKYGGGSAEELEAARTGKQFYGQEGMGGQAAANVFGQSKEMANLGMKGTQQFMGGYQAPQAQMDMNALKQAYQNPWAQEEIDSYSRDVSRGLAENVLPALRLGSASRGSQASSRQSIAEGLAGQRAVSDISGKAAQLRSQQYQMGYGAASQYGASNAQNQFSADQLRAQMGQNLLSQGMQGQQMALGMGQTNVQGGLNMAMMPRQLEQGAQDQYQGMVSGAPKAGFQAAQYGPSMASNIMGLASTGMSMASGLGGK